jgi:hypothetical protein
MRTNRAGTGAKAATVVRPEPVPLDAGFQVVPSSDTSTV